MSDINVSQEDIEAAMANMGGLGAPQTENPIIGHIEKATETKIVKNVTKIQGGEMRCIVSNNGIKPTTIIDGASTQEYNPEDDDVITWITISTDGRQILRQDKDGIKPTTIDTLGPLLGKEAGYGLSYLSSFGGDNNILLDDEKVNKYNEADVYANELMGDSDQGLKTLVASMCTHTTDFREICETWDKARVYNVKEDPEITIDWGCEVATESEYVEFTTVYIIMWARPIVMSTDGEQIPDSLLQVVTRQVNPDNVPRLGQDSKATFMVKETINEQVAAYAVVTEDTLNRKLLSIKLHKTETFDVTKSSF